jgi:hypothetical protein
MINRDEFLKNPDKFGDVVILSSADYEEFEAYQEMLAAEADVDAGNFYMSDEFDKLMSEYIAQREAYQK